MIELNFIKPNFKFVKKKFGPCESRNSVKCIEFNNELIILKYFKGKNYFNEKKIYLILKDEIFLPKLKYFDDNRKILGFQYCGKCLLHYNNFTVTNKKFMKEAGYLRLQEKNITFDNSLQHKSEINFELNILPQLKKICTILKNKYNLYHNDILLKNICIDKQKILLIDWENASSKCMKHRESLISKYR